MVDDKKISSMLDNGIKNFDIPIINRKVFTDPWEDNDIIGRDEVVSEIIKFIVNVLHNQKSYLVVDGKTGSGKSFLIRSIIKTIKRKNDNSFPRVFYANATEMTLTVFRSDLLSSMGMARNATYKNLEEQISDKGLIVIIDKIENVSRPSSYFKNVILPLISIDFINLIFLTNDGTRVLRYLNKHASGVGVKQLKLRNYNENEIVQILVHRLRNGTTDGSHNKFSTILLRYLAQEIIENYDCNIRFAINVLYNTIVESYKTKKKPTIQMINNIIEKMVGNVSSKLNKFNLLEDHFRFLLISVSDCVEYTRQKELYGNYENVCKLFQKIPRTYMWYNNWLHKIAGSGIIDISREGGKGSGRKSNYIMLKINNSDLKSVVNKYYDNPII
jgi:Cdc6-like AAA superfamily ATPase